MGSATQAGRSLLDRACVPIEDPGRAAAGMDTLVERLRGLFPVVRRC